VPEVPSQVTRRALCGIVQVMEVPWKFHGSSMEVPWKFHGSSMEVPWKFQGFGSWINPKIAGGMVS